MSAAAPSAEAGAIPPSDGSVGHALRRLSVYVRRNWVYYSIWAVLTLAYVAGMVVFPLLVGWAVAGAVEGVPTEEVTRRCMLVLGVALARSVLRFFTRLLVFNAAREVEYEMRNDLFAHLQTLPQSFYFRWRTGDLMSRAVNDLNAVRLLLGPGLLTAVQTPILFALILGTMFSMSWKLTLLVLVPYPLFVIIARSFGRAMYTRSLNVQQALADMSNHVQEAVAGIAVVKAYAMEAEQERRFEGANQMLFRRWLESVNVMGGMPAITGLLPALSMWAVLIVGAPQVESGAMGVGTFISFAIYIRELTFPTFTLGWAAALVQRGAAAMQRIDEVLSTEPSIANRGGDELADVDALRGEIEFRGLTFRYLGAEREPALRDVSLRVPAGSTLGVVGPVGSGKSTLASVIPRLYEVDDGQVLLDGTCINRLPLETLRASIAMVPQDSFLFSMTLAENIAYGDPDATREAIVEAAERAQLAKDIVELPNGFDTIVGERGVMLSGGQRQRTALARALLLRPSVLILDDTLSAVDAETEAAIQANLREVFAGRTVVVVANRVSTVRECDQIVVLDEGRLVELGTHEELMRKGGLYSRLASEQEREDRLSRVSAVGEVA